MTTWMRFENKPVTKWGIEFRSVLEVNVAEQLDALGIDWAFERGVPDSIYYLPDFTILGKPDPDFRCPTWIEVKPGELLYRARDHFNLPEKFTEDTFVHSTVDDFLSINPDGELAKPKFLAERYEQSVLVVYKINANSCLSIEMRPNGAVFSRSHPLVNWKTVLKEREAEERRIYWETIRAEQQAEREADMARRAKERAVDAQRNLAAFKTYPHRPARYPTRCCVCGQTKAAEWMRIAYIDDDIRWIGCCLEHLH